MGGGFGAGLAPIAMPRPKAMRATGLGDRRSSLRAEGEKEDVDLGTLLQQLLNAQKAQEAQQGAPVVGGVDEGPNGLADFGRDTWGEFDLDEEETLDAMSRVGMGTFGNHPFGALAGWLGDNLTSYSRPTNAPIPAARPAGLTGSPGGGGGGGDIGFGNNGPGMGGDFGIGGGFGPGADMSGASFGGFDGGGGDVSYGGSNTGLGGFAGGGVGLGEFGFDDAGGGGFAGGGSSAF